MPQMEGKLLARSGVVAFMALPQATGDPIYKRMQGFTSLGTSKNPKEYARQYVDEEFEQTDVTGFSPSIAFGFDRYDGNDVHDFLIEIIDNDLIGNDAVVQILSVDLSKPSGMENASLRPYAVISDSEGDSMDAYTYSGNFRVKGTKEKGTAVVSADGLTATYTPTTAAASTP